MFQLNSSSTRPAYGSARASALKLMKKLLLVCAAVSLTFGAIAADFDARVSAGEFAEKRTEGAQYLSVLGPAYGEAMRICIPPGSKDPSNLGRFELVADISSAGGVLNTTVRPQTPVSLCFAREFAKARLVAPPRLAGADLYPIYISMQMTP
jgi:hypothetical protein